MKRRTLLRNGIHTVLLTMVMTGPGGCWGGPGRSWLASLELPPSLAS
jgi:hypothetical protein